MLVSRTMGWTVRKTKKTLKESKDEMRQNLSLKTCRLNLKQASNFDLIDGG